MKQQKARNDLTAMWFLASISAPLRNNGCEEQTQEKLKFCEENNFEVTAVVPEESLYSLTQQFNILHTSL